MQVQALHAARLANLEGALCALLREAAADHDPNHKPDGISARMDLDGIEIEYTRGGMPVAGEGL